MTDQQQALSATSCANCCPDELGIGEGKIRHTHKGIDYCCCECVVEKTLQKLQVSEIRILRSVSETSSQLRDLQDDIGSGSMSPAAIQGRIEHIIKTLPLYGLEQYV